MTRYAAYTDFSIYALGDTPEAAIEQAIEDTREPDAQFDTAPVSDDLAAYIDKHGWDGNSRSFDLLDGVLVDTADLLDQEEPDEEQRPRYVADKYKRAHMMDRWQRELKR